MVTERHHTWRRGCIGMATFGMASDHVKTNTNGLHSKTQRRDGQTQLFSASLSDFPHIMGPQGVHVCSSGPQKWLEHQ